MTAVLNWGQNYAEDMGSLFVDLAKYVQGKHVNKGNAKKEQNARIQRAASVAMRTVAILGGASLVGVGLLAVATVAATSGVLGGVIAAVAVLALVALGLLVVEEAAKMGDNLRPDNKRGNKIDIFKRSETMPNFLKKLTKGTLVSSRLVEVGENLYNRYQS